MEFGAHLPLMTWGSEEPASLATLARFVRRADELEFTWVTSNDHLVYSRPWLDCLVTLSSVLPSAGTMTLGTTIALPVVRGPGPLAKALATIDRFSQGRLVVGVGPGSSERDYRAMGIPWEERWPRFDEAVQALRALLRPGGDPFVGEFYSTEGMELLPGPARPGGPPIWVGSWGSDAGLRRVARLADGWLASAYNTTPEAFADALRRLRAHLGELGKDPATFPNTLATMWCHLSEDEASAESVLTDVLAPMLRRSPDDLRQVLLVGPSGRCAELLARYAAAGVERVLLWPVGDPLEQLDRFHDTVLPRLAGG